MAGEDWSYGRLEPELQADEVTLLSRPPVMARNLLSCTLGECNSPAIDPTLRRTAYRCALLHSNTEIGSMTIDVSTHFVLHIDAVQSDLKVHLKTTDFRLLDDPDPGLFLWSGWDEQPRA
ncbi:hypothetical protein ACQP1V_16145 [Microtetraspora malaysiensis]|uniref:hypothetical protein n=1 Tax=Microtetraspora malaysiensis TaxID=161358 RepID=UPI003D8A0E03